MFARGNLAGWNLWVYVRICPALILLTITALFVTHDMHSMEELTGASPMQAEH